MKKILVTRHSALGDFIMTMGAFRSIRAFHMEDHLALLTTAPYASLAEACGYFDEILMDKRPKLRNLATWRHLIRELRGRRFDRVYDLQRKQRPRV